MYISLAGAEHAAIDWLVAKWQLVVAHHPAKLLGALVRERQLSIGPGELFDERLELADVSYRHVEVQDVLVDPTADLRR